MPTSKLLIFSDIHNDWKTLERILAVEADFYISAGDQVTWGRGLDACGQILKTRGDKVWVLPGNHESAPQIAGFCDQYGLHDFHQRHALAGVRVSVNDMGATPAVVSLRLDQAVSELAP